MSEVGWIGLSIRGTSWRTVMFVALAYFTAGLAAELLAVPPGGHALPLWPAAGLALAALLVCGFRCWPGIWIGSLLYSLWLDVSLAGVTAGVLESTGAVLQALFGAWLTRRYFTIPIPLARESHVLRFLFFGGPVACVVAASVGVLVLVGFRDVPPSDAMAQWFTWWGGDTLGVLLFTPLFLLAWPGWRRLWVGGGPRVALPLLIITALLTGGHFALDRLERDRTRAAAEEQMDEVYRAGILPFATVIESLNGVERFFSSSVEVTRREFANYVRGITRHPEVLAVDWAPRVPRERLSAVEALAGAEGVDAYRVFELDADGQPAPPGERDDYFPVFYSEPAASNAVALGLDHGFEAPRREAMALARDRGTAAATAITPLLRTDQQVNLVFVPVYRPHLNAEQADVAARHEALLGFVVGVLDLRSLFDPLVSAARTRRLALRITDVTPGDPPQLLLDSLPDGVGADWSREAVVVGRLVRLEMSPATDFLRPGASTEAQIFVGFSLLAAFLASFAALSAAGRAAATEAEVAARTNELREREQDLDITLRSIGDAVLATDPQGRVTRMNPIAEHLTGWP
ncbi:MAG: CHASE domain-containing protein, partial [Chromatiales bacterium]|nr:CHASE domain-containing protein [Chromatiales bacterium]